METLPIYDPTLFQGAAAYYSQYRPRYPEALFAKLTALFQLNGQGRLLDLGTGTGAIALALQHQFETVVAVDPDLEMLREAQRQATLAQVQNITWLTQTAESLTPALGTFKLITIGRAFHWMQRELVLARSYTLLEPGGGVALFNTREDPWKTTYPWKQTAIAVVKQWLGEQRRAGQGLWTYPDPPHAEVLARSPFQDQAVYEFPFEQVWTVPSFIGYLYSTAFCLKDFLGDQAEPFEQAIADALLAVEPSGQFREEITASLRVAWKR